METPEVSSTGEVLEGLRQNLVSSLQAQGIAVPQKALVPGACFQAVLAYQRLAHRRLAAIPRKVGHSPELLANCQYLRFLDPLDELRAEFERGDDLTQRLTRHFFRSGFNDFLFNNFGIHHLHLGARNSSLDKTGKHSMAAGGRELLFAWVTPSEAYFLDVLDHDVFDDAEMTKRLVQIALRDRPEFVQKHVVPGVVDADQSFEEAFEIAKLGFTTLYELDGYFFLTGNTVMDGVVTNGRRGTCTSTEVVAATNRVLNQIVSLVDYLRSNAGAVATALESSSGRRPSTLALEVVEFGRVLLLRECESGTEFVSEGPRRGYRFAGATRFTPFPF